MAICKIQLCAIHCALIGCRAGGLRHQEALVIDLLLRNPDLAAQGLKAFEVGLRLRQQPFVVLAQSALCLLQGHLEWPRIDLREEIALFGDLAFLEPTSVGWPLICVCTVTVSSDVTVPSMFRMMRMSPLSMNSLLRRWGAAWAARAAPAFCGLGCMVGHQYQPRLSLRR